MNDRPDPDAALARELDALLALPADDPRRREALASPRMRALLREFEDFTGGRDDTAAPIPAGDVADALRRLGPVAASPAPRRGPRPTRARWWMAAAAVVVLAVGVRVAFDALAPQPPQLRGPEASPTLEVHLARGAGGVLILQWTPVPDATSARVEVFDVDLREAGSWDVTAGGRAELTLDPDLPADLVLRLIVRGAAGELGRSPLTPVPRP